MAHYDITCDCGVVLRHPAYTDEQPRQRHSCYYTVKRDQERLSKVKTKRKEVNKKKKLSTPEATVEFLTKLTKSQTIKWKTGPFGDSWSSVAPDGSPLSLSWLQDEHCKLIITDATNSNSSIMLWGLKLVKLVDAIRSFDQGPPVPAPPKPVVSKKFEEDEFLEQFMSSVKSIIRRRK